MITYRTGNDPDLDTAASTLGEWRRMDERELS